MAGDFGAVPAVDGNRVIGIVTDRDLVVASWLRRTRRGAP
jgi:CBS domain-containing protein